MRKTHIRNIVRATCPALLILCLSVGRVSAQANAFVDSFNNNNAGWTVNSNWQIGGTVATAQQTTCTGATLYGDPGVNADGVASAGILGLKIGGSGTIPYTGFLSTIVESPYIPVPSGSIATLKFSQWLNIEGSASCTMKVNVWNGSSWITLWQNSTAAIASSSWQTVSYDVSAYANANFKIRFLYQMLGPCAQTSGMNIDNLSVIVLGDEQFVNGSFEFAAASVGSSLPVNGLNSTVCTGWIPLLSGIDIVGSYWTASQGFRSIDLCGINTGGLVQGVRLRSNKNYAVLFDASVHPVVPAASMTLNVYIPGVPSVTLATQTYNLVNNGNSASNMHWAPYGLTFSTDGIADPTPIIAFQFISNTFGGSGNALDNMRIVPLETIQNGSFETLAPGNNPLTGAVYSLGNTTMTGWTVTLGDVHRVASYWVCPDGIGSLDVSGFNVGEVSQTLTLIPNRTYRVDFDMAGNIGQTGVKTLDVSAVFSEVGATTSTSSYAFDTAGKTTTNMGWTTKSFYFTTPANTAGFTLPVLKFRSTTASAWGPVIDNVRIVPLPGNGQANTSTAALKVNGTGALNVAGPWFDSLNGSSMTLTWQGSPLMPYILIASFDDSARRPLPPIGSLDVGSAIDFSDIFVIFDGTVLPGAFFYLTDAAGNATLTIPITGITPGTEFALQGLVQQLPSAASPFLFTAAHHLVRF